jgi:hypothetical protein
MTSHNAEGKVRECYTLADHELCHHTDGVTQKADAWGLGCMLYELMMLKHVHFGHSLEQLSSKIRSGTFDKNLPGEYSKGLRVRPSLAASPP